MSETLSRTPLHRLHVRHGARMVAFAGYEMPVQYPTGILKDHLHTRAAAGLFEVRHMVQLCLRPRSGRLEDAALALERLIPMEVTMGYVPAASAAPGTRIFARLRGRELPVQVARLPLSGRVTSATEGQR